MTNPTTQLNHSGMSVLSWSVFACLLLLLVSCRAQAQLATAALNGVVKDSSGAVIPGATVELKNANTNVTHTALTNADGIYVLLQIPPGTYMLLISKAGFETKTQGPFTLSVNQTTSF